MPPGDHRTLAASDFLDWIMPALLDCAQQSTSDTQASKPWKIRVIDNNQQKSVETSKVFHSLEPWVNSLLSAPAVDELWKTDQDREAERRTENQMKKYSVTALLQKAGQRIFMEEEQTPEEKRTPDYVARAMRRYSTERLPAFMTRRPDTDGAARGTVIHRFLSLVDLDRIRQAGGENLEKELEALRGRLEKEGVFSPAEAGWIRVDKICRFFASPLGCRLLASPEVHREWEFNLSLPERDLLVQGMIDCAFREGDGWILVDYKTDKIGDEEAFTEEYRPQLAWYREALSRLTGLPVKECWLYALSVDKMFPVPLSGAAYETIG